MVPKLNDNSSTHIVVPNSIQMGWIESMCVFYAGSETARDTVEKLLKIKSLSPHPLDHHMLPSNLESTNEHKTIKI